MTILPNAYFEPRADSLGPSWLLGAVILTIGLLTLWWWIRRVRTGAGMAHPAVTAVARAALVVAVILGAWQLYHEVSTILVGS